jgi:hypothetical protein
VQEGIVSGLSNFHVNKTKKILVLIGAIIPQIHGLGRKIVPFSDYCAIM